MPARGTTVRVIPKADPGVQFQSTCPHGARPPDTCQPASGDPISIHVPARGTTELDKAGRCGRDISIHVPARGTTRQRDRNVPIHEISIHVPARGTTQPDRVLSSLNLFQSTCPHGARLAKESVKLPYFKISIHVPARGTTRAKRKAVAAGKFQSTCPHGARLVTGSGHQGPLYFNPRARTGHDSGTMPVSQVEAISIHVPARGTTGPARWPCQTGAISIHVPARGTT